MTKGIDVVAVAQVFERSGYRLVSWADDGITSPEQWGGKKLGVWAGHEMVSATINKYGLTEGSGDDQVELVGQGFDMQLLLERQVDLASAMIYNEFAQLIAAGNPVSDFHVVDFGDHDTNTLEDALLARGEWLEDEDNQDIVTRFLRASAKGWAVCADDPGRSASRSCSSTVRRIAARSSDLDDERNQQADVAVVQGLGRDRPGIGVAHSRASCWSTT